MIRLRTVHREHVYNKPKKNIKRRLATAIRAFTRHFFSFFLIAPSPAALTTRRRRRRGCRRRVSGHPPRRSFDSTVLETDDSHSKVQRFKGLGQRELSSSTRVNQNSWSGREGTGAPTEMYGTLARRSTLNQGRPFSTHFLSPNSYFLTLTTTVNTTSIPQRKLSVEKRKKSKEKKRKKKKTTSRQTPPALNPLGLMTCSHSWFTPFSQLPLDGSGRRSSS